MLEPEKNAILVSSVPMKVVGARLLGGRRHAACPLFYMEFAAWSEFSFGYSGPSAIYGDLLCIVCF